MASDSIKVPLDQVVPDPSLIIPVEKLEELKPEIRQAIKRSGLLIADKALVQTVNAYKSGSNILVQHGSDVDDYRSLVACAFDRVERSESALQVLVVSPFRDDVMKIHKTMQKFNEQTSLGIHASVSGVSFSSDKQVLQTKTVQVLAGTEGRILDLHWKGIIDVSQVRMLVVDNADKMLDKGRPRNSILSILPPTLQFLLFAHEVTSKAETFIRNPGSRLFRHLFETPAEFAPAAIMRAVPAEVVKSDGKSSPTRNKSREKDGGGKSPLGDDLYYFYAKDEGKKLSELMKLVERLSEQSKIVIACKSPDSSYLVSLALNKAKVCHTHLHKACGSVPSSYFVKRFNSASSGVLLMSYGPYSLHVVEQPSAVILYDMPSSRSLVTRLLDESDKTRVVFFLCDADVKHLLSKHYHRDTGFKNLSMFSRSID